MVRRHIARGAIAAAIAALAAPAHADLAVGAKAELRHRVLAEATAQYLTAHGIAAGVRPGYSAPTLLGAQRDGAVDVAWESVGIALTTRHAVAIASARDLGRRTSIDRLRAESDDGQIAWPAVAPAAGGPVIAVRDATAEALDAATIAALLRRLRADETARFGITTGFAGRPDGIRALAAAAPPPVTLAQLRRLRGAALFAALADGTLTAAALPRNDARAHGDDLVALRDAGGAFPDHSLALGVRRDALADHPTLADRLRRLARHVDGAALRRMTRDAARAGTAVRTAAAAFLRRAGLRPEGPAHPAVNLTSSR